MKLQQERLDRFIENQKDIFRLSKLGFSWESGKWDVSTWLPHRGASKYLTFFMQSKGSGCLDMFKTQKADAPLPLGYSDFIKAMVVYLVQKNKIGYIAARNVNDCRRLYNIMFLRKEDSPCTLTKWHFSEVIRVLREDRYKMLYEVAANLQAISDAIDKNKITISPIEFKNPITQMTSHHGYTKITDLSDDNKRAYEEKLPSYEAMEAYAYCTNNPMNNDEEILLRTIDLLIAMGQRGNEITYIPLDCWVEIVENDINGHGLSDAHGNPIIKTGIRYFAEKRFQSRVHWLASQDIPFARKAYGRLLELTAGYRKNAIWQEENPGRVWQHDPTDNIIDTELLNLMGFAHSMNLRGFLDRYGIKPTKRDSLMTNLVKGRKIKAFYYNAGEIEKLLLSKLEGPKLLVEGTKTVLLKSELLSLSCEGAFRFKRINNTFSILPKKVAIAELNGALGSILGIESIFERRNLTEADGSKIVLTSHQPRHWRNTLYELGGMSNVQQALALGRQKLDQNTVYQHGTLAEKNFQHREFVSFASPLDKITFLHQGIRNRSVKGDLTDTYHWLLKNKGEENAASFLRTHGSALHVTPFGGCTHDFSQTPCLKHLQCWNGCSHLHRTNSIKETKTLQDLLVSSKEALRTMQREGMDDYGSDVWTKDLDIKIKNIEKALSFEISDSPQQVFPNGKPMAVSVGKRKTSSV